MGGTLVALTARMPRAAHLLACLAALSSGCLSNTYTIREAELARLAGTAPEERGERVRVVERLGRDHGVPPAPAVGTTVVVVADSSPSGRTTRRTRRTQSRREMGSDADSGAAVAVAVAVIAAAAGIGIAATEGARYDGFVEVDPKHPVHLRRGDEYAWVPLSGLTQDDVEWAEEAILLPEEGPWRPLGRAPLDRKGFVYQLDVGALALDDAVGGTEWGGGASIGLGYFPLQQLGVLLDFGFGIGERSQGTILNGRYGVEVQGYPLQLARLHVGLFGQLGFSQSWHDVRGGTRRQTGAYYGGGGIMQVDLTTRLALNIRGGVNILPDGQLSPEVGLGFAVY